MHIKLTADHKSKIISCICQVAIIEAQLKEIVDELEYESDIEYALQLSALEANTLKVKLSNHLID